MIHIGYLNLGKYDPYDGVYGHIWVWKHSWRVYWDEYDLNINGLIDELTDIY